MLPFALTTSKWMLDVVTRLVKADVRVHHAEAVRDDLAIIFVVNHFTRLETLLLPYFLHKRTGRVIWSLAAAELFQGRIGAYLEQVGAVSTKDPDRDKLLVHSLLKGDNPWIIFPEGAMIKDKKVVSASGAFQVFNRGKRRPPHRGAAALALVAEFFRHKLECLKERPDQSGAAAVLERFGLDSIDQALQRRTAIVPVNITYYPIRTQENVFLKLARAVAKNGLSPRAVEELSVEGTVLAEDTDIDIVLGDPIDVRAYLNEPQYAELMACGVHDLQHLEADPRSLFHDAARRLMLRYMEDIYYLTTINPDHLLAGLMRAHRAGPFSLPALRHRFFLCTRKLEQLNYRPVHGSLSKTARRAVCEASDRRFESFLRLAESEGSLEQTGAGWTKPPAPRGHREFDAVRQQEPSYVIANEIEAIPVVRAAVHEAAKLPQQQVANEVRRLLLEEAETEFNADYNAYYNEALSKPPDVGRPFLLEPKRVLGGVVLSHGYMAAPLEVRALAEHLCAKGYAVYGLRLPGHGTAPADLARVHWEDWLETFNHGYALMRTLTKRVVFGGFSMGAGLALLAASEREASLRGVFAIDAPLYLRNYLVHLVPSMVRMSAFLKRIRVEHTEWEYLANEPENPHINYTRNPLHGLRQLGQAMDAMKARLPLIAAPTLIVQGSADPVVTPASGWDIFARVGTPHKQLRVFERGRHGIVNGEGAEDIFDAVHQFLDWALAKTPALPETVPEPAAAEAPAPMVLDEEAAAE